MILSKHSNRAIIQLGKRLTQSSSTSLLNRKYSTQSDPDFLHESSVPTYHFQKSLPRLPIPKLDKTCERYLTSQRPLLSDTQFTNTEAIVKDFQDGLGKELHDALVTHDKANKHTSYISDPWFDMYLEARDPLVLNYNPFIAFNDDPNQPYNDQLIRTTNLIVSSLRFMKTLRAGVLEPEVFHLNPAKSDTEKFRKFVRRLPEWASWYGAFWYKAFPLDMSQYKRLFNSTRIPREDKDELYTSPDKRHIVVIRNGNFYSFDVIDENGSIRSPIDIMACIKHILSDTTPAPTHPLAVMTSQNRNTWADVRNKLIAAGNTKQLKTIDSAVFALSLDDDASKDNIAVSRSFLHGDGSNRWFDKSFNLILNRDGKASVNFEHAWGDGVAILRYFNEVYKDSTEKPRVHPDTQPSNIDTQENVSRLDFTLTDELKSDLETAMTNFNNKISQLQLNYVEYKKASKQFVKEKKFSPDAFMQLAIQMAFYRQYGQTVATYESCSTAAFRHGRTETIRPATMETQKTCAMFNHDSGASAGELKAAMDECSHVHGSLTKDAAMGQGFDRHLFGLRHIAEGQGITSPMFQDPAYANINHNILSTSTLSSPAVLIGGFAPVVSDGYGVGYGIDDDRLGFVVTSYPSRSVNDFLDCMYTSLDDMVDVLNGKDFKK